jgi:hypothetical protein
LDQVVISTKYHIQGTEKFTYISSPAPKHIVERIPVSIWVFTTWYTTMPLPPRIPGGLFMFQGLMYKEKLFQSLIDHAFQLCYLDQ